MNESLTHEMDMKQSAKEKRRHSLTVNVVGTTETLVIVQRCHRVELLPPQTIFGRVQTPAGRGRCNQTTYSQNKHYLVTADTTRCYLSVCTLISAKDKERGNKFVSDGLNWVHVFC